jgi:hypothetical protein
LKIEKINRLAYDVSIKSSDVAIVDEYFNDEIKTAIRAYNEIPEKLIPIEEKNIKSPVIITDPKVVSPVDTKKIEVLISAIAQKENDILVIENGIINHQKQILVFEENIKKDSLKNDLLITKDLEIEKRIMNNRYQVLKLKKDIDIEKNKILQKQNEINSKNNEILKLKSNSEIISSTFNNLNSNYLTILTQYLKIKDVESAYNNYKQLAFSPLLNYKSYSTKRDEKDFILGRIDEYKECIVKFNNLVNSFTIEFYNAINTNNLLNVSNEISREYINSKYQQIKDEVDKIKANAETLDLSNIMVKIVAIDNVLNNEKAYEILSAPIQPFEDYVTFEVKIKHRDQKRISEYDDNREFTYMEYTRGGVRFDFSTGVVFNFGGNNNDYEIKDVIAVEDGANVNKKEIVLTSKNDFTPMLSGMFHTSFRRSGMWAIGLTLGASLNVETFQLNSLFPGVSILIGKKQKFILTAGPSFRQVDVLKDNYETDTLYPIGDFSDTSQLTSKQFKIGGFFGITYNLTQKQRGKFKINGAE